MHFNTQYTWIIQYQRFVFVWTPFFMVNMFVVLFFVLEYIFLFTCMMFGYRINHCDSGKKKADQKKGEGVMHVFEHPQW